MKLRVFLVIVILFAASVALAQISVDVALVNLVATVTDDRGRYVAGLKADDFSIEEDGKTLPVSHASYSDDVPISLGIVLDTSGSMELKIGTATSAVERFIRTIHRDDDIFLMTFSNFPTLVQDFTSDRTRLNSALRRVRVQGGTALYDALLESLSHLKKGTQQKKAILLLTDGVDENSLRSFREAESAVRSSEYIVYCLGISPSEALIERGPISIPSTGPGGTGPTFPGGTGRPQGPQPTIQLPGGISIPFPTGKFELLPQQQRRPGTGGGGPQGAMLSVDMSVLNAFADDSGGRAWLVGGALDEARGTIDKILDQLAEELRSQYSLAYYPKHDMNDKKWHHVEVRAKNPAYHVRARKDYYGGDSGK